MSEAAFSLLQGDPSDWGLPPTGKTFVGVNDEGQIVTKQHDGTVTVLTAGGVPSLNKQANSDGTVIAITPSTSQHKEVITLTGVARTQVINVAETDLEDGSSCVILFNLPATAGIVVEVYSDATLIWSYENETGAALKAAAELYKDGSTWAPLRESIPAFTPAT